MASTPFKRKLSSVSSPSPKRSRNELDLKRKIELIKQYDSIPKPTQKDLAKSFNVGTSTVSDILKKKEEYLKQFGENAPDKRNRFNSGKFGDLNELIYKWFVQARAKNVPLSGPIIQEKALNIAEELHISDFKASNGWLDSFKDRYGIGFYRVSGESADVDSEIADKFKERLPEITAKYDKKDIFNCDETRLFFRALPDKTLAFKGQQCKGGKLAKERLTVMLACSALGEKLKPFVIGKAENPRCFKGIDKSKLPVKWAFNRKAWMTMDIFKDWVSDLNSQMRRSNRRILIFLDNATSHSHDLKFSHVELKFLPPGTTSVLQPLDLGIIRAFKARYRKRLIKHLLTKLDICEKASEIAKSVSVLDCIYWINASWRETELSTIRKCFLRAGMIQDDDRIDDDDSDDDVPLMELVRSNLGYSPSELRSIDEIEDQIPVEETYEGEWESQLIQSFLDDETRTDSLSEDDDDIDDRELTSDLSYPEVLSMLDKLHNFAVVTDNRFIEKVEELRAMTQDSIVKIKTTQKQSQISDFFKNA